MLPLFPKLSGKAFIVVSLINVGLIALTASTFAALLDNGFEAWRWLGLSLAWIALATRLFGPKLLTSRYGHHLLATAIIWAGSNILSLVLM